MDMPWPGLRSLVALAQHGTVSGAARVQGYTPGAVSQQLASLERAVGSPLLEPAGRGVRLTEDGRLLVEHAGRILRAEEAARAALEAGRRDVAGTLTIATFATFAASLLAPSIAAAARRHPELRLRTLEVHPDHVAATVERGDADLAFGLEYPGAPVPQAAGIDVVPIATERFAVAGRDRRGSRRVALADFAGADWIVAPADTTFGQAVLGACRRAGFEPHVAHVVDDTAASLTMAAQGLGVTFVTPMMLALVPAPGLGHTPLVEDVRRDLVLLQRRAGAERPAVAAVTRIIREAVGDLVA